MDITRYELLTGKVVPEAHRERITELLSLAVAFINTDCGGRFLYPDGVGGVKIVLPLDVEPGIILLVKAFQSNPALASLSLAGMSKSFVQNGEYLAAAIYWKNYKKARFF